MTVSDVDHSWLGLLDRSSDRDCERDSEAVELSVTDIDFEALCSSVRDNVPLEGDIMREEEAVPSAVNAVVLLSVGLSFVTVLGRDPEGDGPLLDSVADSTVETLLEELASSDKLALLRLRLSVALTSPVVDFVIDSSNEGD